MAGLKVLNPNNELVISSDGHGLYCIGKATWLSDTPASGDPDQPSPGKTCAYSTYRINTGNTNPIIAAVELKDGIKTALWGASQSSPGVWDIKLISADQNAPSSYNFFDTMTPANVWVFATPTGPTGNNFGMCIYDKNGNVAYDLTQPYMLFIRSSFNTGLVDTDISFPSTITRPVVFGYMNWDRMTETQYPEWNYEWVDLGETGAMTKTSSTNIHLDRITQQRYGYYGDPRNDNYDNTTDAAIFIIDAAGLPS